MKTVPIGAQIPAELMDQIVRLSDISGQSESAITEEALRQYVTWRALQQEDLKAAIAAADEGDFASEEEVRAFFARHGA
ncbi:CopG family ribbon-helix-helix protein [Pseudoduganella sp. GCM10020061]|uniref:CopG family ribbon-helix-helix protein n=1 Tax=Pseudoduganella sp. GCM10020061 TaxID=3317345 RepID=UPI003640700D